MNSTVNIVVAMKAEARSLIEHFILQDRMTGLHKFKVYQNDHIRLIISGIGSSNAEKAVAVVAERIEPNEISAWLNVGVVGHKSLEIGQALMGNRITDKLASESLYPIFVADFGLRTGKVRTVYEVETDYEEDTAYDMEAYGFAKAASNFAKYELIHCYKVVSDNPDNSVNKLNNQIIGNMVAEHVDAIERVCRQLLEISDSVADRGFTEDSIAPFLDRWHFTAAQQEILRKYLHKTKIMNNEVKVDSDVVRNCRNSSDLLTSIENHLNQYWTVV